MRVRGDKAPSAAFSLEPQPRKPGMMLARFYENITPYEAGYEYDEYHLELADTGGLQADIESNLDHFIETAKLFDEQRRAEEHLSENQRRQDKAIAELARYVCALYPPEEQAVVLHEMHDTIEREHGVSHVAKTFVDLIRDDQSTIYEVPELWHDEVAGLLEPIPNES